MLHFRLTISPELRQALQRKLERAQRHGDVRLVKWILALFAVAHSQDRAQAAAVLQLSEAQVERYVYQFMVYGLPGVVFQKSSGRPAKLTPTQKTELKGLLQAGPQACGLAGGCWRTPLIQVLIEQRFGVVYNVFYLAEFLKNLGFSYQKAKFVSDHLDEVARQRWCRRTWPEIVRQARAQNALLLFGDEASFPQWGSLSYTWAPVGQQPVVQTCGQRKGWKVFGLLDYFSGRLFHQGVAGRLNSDSYCAFLQQVLAQTSEPIYLIQDGARYHTSAATKAFFARHADRLTVYQLPSYSPDYNPIEKLWKKLKQEATHLVYFPTFEALRDTVEQALVKFARRAEEILGLCGLPHELARAA
ncbi:MAG TPA: IS630 family transposase [Blastocatellia bacterium]|nr:IS630 family transposase [Blastocatellia bacterium]